MLVARFDKGLKSFRQVKLQSLGVLTHEDGWCGGTWYISREKSEKVKFNEFSAVSCVRIKRKLIEIDMITRCGYDMDHGEQYAWTGTDYTLRLSTQLGPQHISLLDWMQEHPHSKVEIFKEVKE